MKQRNGICICLQAGALFALAIGKFAAQTPGLPKITTPPPAVPYKWKNVVIRGGGFVTGIVFSTTQKGLVYVRTDVGGAYRSTDAGEHWMPLTDRFGRNDATYLGIESIVLDPSDSNKLYMAEGMYSADWGGPSAIFRSNDQGVTFEKTAMPFKMGGNDDGRGCGERLAVDPNFGSVLYFGSRKAGLWKSMDSGATWAHVDSFPVQEKVTGVGENTGITFVIFDRSSGTKGSETKTIYAGVAQIGAALYRSQDAGATWQLVPDAPKDLFPNHAAIDPGNTLYFSYVDNVGPNGTQDGAIWKYDLHKDKWKDISPIKPGVGGAGKFGYGGLTMDLEHPDTLMVTTIDRWNPGDAIFRTTDAGKKWKDMASTAKYSASQTPWVYWHRDKPGGHGWMNDIKIDPFNPDEVIYGTGEGLWGSANVTAADTGKPTLWGFPNDGLEEIVANQLISPPEGAHLLSVVSDVSGFRHEDVDKTPANGFFIDPQLNSGTGIDFAALAPQVAVRVGYGDGKTPRGGYSLDNGLTWKPFAGEPPGSTKGAGKVAISADGKTVVWTPEKGTAYWTADWGKNWTLCAGLPEKLTIVSDRMSPARFYSFNPETGQFMESLDKAATFATRTQPLAAKGSYAVIAATPGVEGDLWIGADHKVFHSTDSGVTFVTLEGMADVYTIGFGHPAPDSSIPVIYMNGTAANTEGTFRSDDGGQDWITIDDPQHQFGWKNSITGDPRIYGRVYLATGGRGIIYGEPSDAP